MKLLQFLIVTILPFTSIYSQVKRYSIQDFGYITVSTKLEIQSGIYKEFQNKMDEELKKEVPSLPSKYGIVYQQKGLNDLNSQSLTKFVRLMINSIKDNSLSNVVATKKIIISEIEKEEFMKNQKQVAEERAKVIGAKIKGEISFETFKIQRYYTLRVKYLLYHEKMGDIDYCIYYIQNKGFMHIITTCLTIKHKAEYQQDIEKALESMVLL